MKYRARFEFLFNLVVCWIEEEEKEKEIER